MIKQINHQNFLLTPFAAIKAWELFNIENSDLVLIEDQPDTPVAQDYIDYSGTNPILNRDCNIALEQQDNDQVIYQEAITGSGLFDPINDETNIDGTYKRLVYSQIQRAFYNNYNNPVQIFGTEYIDFPLSNTIRNLSSAFRLFSIPQIIFGDRLVPGTIVLYDTSLDDNVVITDDGYQNLLAGPNLFSKIQEVRKWPLGTNEIYSGSSSYNCNTYGSLFITNPQDVYANVGDTVRFYVTASGTTPFYYQWQSGSNYLSDTIRITGSQQACITINNVQPSDTGSYRIMVYNNFLGLTSSYAQLILLPNWITMSIHDSASITSKMEFGSVDKSPIVDLMPTVITGLIDSVGITNVIIPVSSNETSSVDTGFYSGSLIQVIIPIYDGNETSSVDTGFYSGSLIQVIIPIYDGNETSSVDTGFYSGSLTTIVIPTNYTDSTAITTGLISGDCTNI